LKVIKLSVLTILIFLLSGCTNLKVANLDPNSGRFKTDEKATVLKSNKIDLDLKKSLLLVPEHPFIKGQIKNINYFDKTITFSELETLIIKNKLTEKVPSLHNKIGIYKAYNAYKPFLWLRMEIREDGFKRYAQFIITDPKSQEDLFIVEKYLDYIWAGVNDQNTWYPMFNSIVDYIEQNSKTWSHKK